MSSQEYTTTALVVADITILQDHQGRYNLNLLHQASGAAPTKRPTDWLRRKSTQALIEALAEQGEGAGTHLEVVHGGERAGTYAHELLAVSYAGWISPAFQLKVNQAFLDMKRGQPALPRVKDPAIQMLIDMAVHLDEARTLATEAKTLAQQAIDTQQWLTIREFCFLNTLERQMPPSYQQEYGRYLTGYCQEHGVPIRKQPIADRPYTAEHAYHVGTIEQTWRTWLYRRAGQPLLTVIAPDRDGNSTTHDPGVPYRRSRKVTV